MNEEKEVSNKSEKAEENNKIKSLSKRIKELGDKSTQILLFLSFAMVSIVELEKHTQNWEQIINDVNSPLFWWKIALIPILLGVLPLKELEYDNANWYHILVKFKIFLLWFAIGMILIGIFCFFSLSSPPSIETCIIIASGYFIFICFISFTRFGSCFLCFIKKIINIKKDSL